MENKLKFEDLRNESRLVFTDISSEKRRVYLKDNTVMIDIEEPVALHISDSGGHRIMNSKGNCYYIKPTWTNIRWFVKEGGAHFVK